MVEAGMRGRCPIRRQEASQWEGPTLQPLTMLHLSMVPPLLIATVQVKPLTHEPSNHIQTTTISYIQSLCPQNGALVSVVKLQ